MFHNTDTPQECNIIQVLRQESLSDTQDIRMLVTKEATHMCLMALLTHIPLNTTKPPGTTLLPRSFAGMMSDMPKQTAPKQALL